MEKLSDFKFQRKLKCWINNTVQSQSYLSIHYELPHRIKVTCNSFDRGKIICQGKWYQMACLLSKNIYPIV